MEKYVNEITNFICNNKEFKFLDQTSSYNYAIGDTFSLNLDGTQNLPSLVFKFIISQIFICQK